MNNAALKQRIQYLIEHGGVSEDPLTELYRKVRQLHWLVVTALTLNVVQFGMRVM